MTRNSSKISLFINNISLPGGTERAVANLANNLATNGHHVEIVSLYTHSGESFYTLKSGISLAHIGLRLRPSAKKRFALLLPVMLRLALKRRTRVLIGTNHAVNIALGIASILKMGSKRVACEHVVYEAAPEYVQNLRRWFYPRLDQTVVLTETDAEKYRLLNELTNVVVIPNEIPFWPAISAECVNKTMIAIGHFKEVKGFDLLIDSVKDVIRSNSDWTLVIVGEGETKEAIQQQILNEGLEEQIQLLLPRQEVESLYLSSSVYLMSSRPEAFGMVLIEAKACGLPIVAYDCPSGPREILTPEDGFLIPMGDKKAYAASVERLIADAPLRQRMGAAARKDAIRFSSESVYAQWASVLRM